MFVNPSRAGIAVCPSAEKCSRKPNGFCHHSSEGDSTSLLAGLSRREACAVCRHRALSSHSRDVTPQPYHQGPPGLAPAGHHDAGRGSRSSHRTGRWLMAQLVAWPLPTEEAHLQPLHPSEAPGDSYQARISGFKPHSPLRSPTGP